MRPQRLQKIYRCCLFAATILFFSSASALHAGAPFAKDQAPGFYRMMVGQFEVTALSDGWIEVGQNHLGNASVEEIRKLLAGSFLTEPTMKASSNVYLINTGTKLILVDAGNGDALRGAMGPDIGFMAKNMKAAGYDPAQVDAVLITHMHGDHIGGLLTASGERAFSKADVFVSKAESNFFLSKEVAAKMPPAFQVYFKLARDIAAPYIAAGKWKTFESDLPFPGIQPIAIPGHTPGHTGYEITNGNQTLLVWGDLVHSAAAQFAKPDVCLIYDLDRKQAVTVRKALFKKAAGGKVLVAGMHLPFPGIGRLRADGEDTFAFVPVEFSPVQ